MPKFNLFASALFPVAPGSSTILRNAMLSVMASATTLVGLDSAQAQLKYHVIPIAPGFGEGVNNKGDVVGTLAIGHAFLYKKRATTDLGVFYTPQDPYYESTEGYGVNDSDAVVGDISNHAGPKGGYTPGAFDAFLWLNGKLMDIAQGTSDGGASATARGINSRGEVVGTYDAGVFLHISPFFGYPHAYLCRDGLRTDIGTLGGSFSYGYGINDAGQIVGVSSEVPGFSPAGLTFKAYLYTNGRMKAIGGAQSDSFTPEAINDNGWITGTLVSGNDNAVLYINGQIIPLSTIKGFLGSQGISINNIGMVVGNLLGNLTSSTFPPFTYVGAAGGFVYYGWKMYDLNHLVDGGWKILSVGHINDFGQIAATGALSGSTVTYALLLDPILVFKNPAVTDLEASVAEARIPTKWDGSRW